MANLNFSINDLKCNCDTSCFFPSIHVCSVCPRPMNRIFPTVLKYFLMLSLVHLGAICLLRGGTSSKSIIAAHALQPPKIDGELTEEVWQSTTPAGDFLQYDPDEGAAPT